MADTQNRLNEIILQADAVVIDVFINPPTDTALDALTAASLEDATIKQSILNLQADHDAELLDEYESAMEQLEIEKATKEQAAEAAEAAKVEAEAAPTSRRPPGSRPPSPSRSSAGSTIARPRPTCSRTSTPPWPSRSAAARPRWPRPSTLDEEILAERAWVAAAALAEQADANRYITGIKPGRRRRRRGLPRRWHRRGGRGHLRSGRAPAERCGRRRLRAVRLRVPRPGRPDRRARSNCGTSSYAIYQMPASSCSPPTAKPGTSMHEQGLAIDFTSGGRTIGSTSGAYRWLKANASNYGLYNLPGEAWHWSVDGN